MTKKKKIVINVLVAVFLVVSGFFAVRTFTTNGQDALDRMSPAEREFLVKLHSLARGMSYEQVVETLGTPDDEGPLHMRPRWNVGGNPLDPVAVYILPNAGAYRFLWIGVGRFTYEEQLRTK